MLAVRPGAVIDLPPGRGAAPLSTPDLVEGAGHFPHLDDPDRFARVLREFVAGDEGEEPLSRTGD